MTFYMHVQVGATFFGMHVQIDGKESIKLRPSSHEFLCEKWPSEMPPHRRYLRYRREVPGLVNFENIPLFCPAIDICLIIITTIIII